MIEPRANHRHGVPIDRQDVVGGQHRPGWLVAWQRIEKSWGQAVPSPIEIHLASGTQANEACTPPIARPVFRMRSKRGARAAHFEVPDQYTFHALIDHPGIAVTDGSIPAGERCLNVDLHALDEPRAAPSGALVFEFHSSEDTHPLLHIDPGKPVGEDAVGGRSVRRPRPDPVG